MLFRNNLGFVINGAVLAFGRAASLARLVGLRLRFPGLTVEGSVRISRGCSIYLHRGGRMHLDGAYICQGVTLTSGRGAALVIRADYVGQNSTIVARESIYIGAGSQIAENVVVRDSNHDHSVPLREKAFTAAPVHIDMDVWLGASSVILSGVEVGRGATVAAGAVVTKSVPPSATVGGVPARYIGST